MFWPSFTLVALAGAILLLIGVAAFAQQAPPLTIEDVQNALNEADTMTVLVKSRAENLAVQLGRANKEIQRLTDELAKSKADAEKAKAPAAPTPPTEVKP